MPIYPESSYKYKEELSSSKLNSMVTNINNHDHASSRGNKIDPINSIVGSEQGAIYYDNGTTLTKLSPGGDGTILRSNGSSQNPEFSLELGVGRMEIQSASSDDFSILTKTITPNPNFLIGYGNGSGGLDTSKEYIVANGGTIRLHNASLYIDGDISDEGGFFGEWADRSASTSYLAETDGFVCAYTTLSWNQQNYIYGYTDSSNPPSTVVALQNGGANQDDQNYHINYIGFPVKKGNYYRVIPVSVSLTSYKWLPIGI